VTIFIKIDNVIKVENFNKNCLTLTRKNQKSRFKLIQFGRSKSLVKGLSKKINIGKKDFVDLEVNQILAASLN
jgi:hypothetical protein